MPFKSKSHVRWGIEQVKLGKMSQATFDEWMAKTRSVSSLPERLGEKRNRPVTKPIESKQTKKLSKSTTPAHGYTKRRFGL